MSDHANYGAANQSEGQVPERPAGETSPAIAQSPDAQNTEHEITILELQTFGATNSTINAQVDAQIPRNQGSGDPGVVGTSRTTSKVSGIMAVPGYDIEAPPIELVSSVVERLSMLGPQIPQNCSIFRVPVNLRESNDKAYTPQLVSIGPLHWGNPELIGMEEHKWRHLPKFLDRTAVNRETCLGLIRMLEQQVRDCYAETIQLGSDEFVKMVLVDSCFILESILRYSADIQEQGFYHYVGLDLVLVENQLPFFVLNHIFDLAFTHHPLKNNQPVPQLIKLLVDYFKPILLISYPDTNGILSPTVKHLADFVRLLHIPLSKRQATQGSNNEKYVRVETATALKEAGVRIQSHYFEGFLDLEFLNGVLIIPRMRLNNCAEQLLRNLISLEFYLYQHDSYVLDCAVFMDDLISTGKDVEILVNSGVIENYIGESEAVANMFNTVTSQYLFHSYHFCNISWALKSYYENPENKWMATLKREYCSTPFKVASVVVATILLLLTLMQTVGTIVSLSTKDSNIALKVTAIAIAATVVAVMIIIFSLVLLRMFKIIIFPFRIVASDIVRIIVP